MKRKIRNRLIWSLFVVVGLAVCMIFLRLTWLSSGQARAVSVAEIESTIRLGMSLDEITRALGKAPGALDHLAVALPDGDPTAQFVVTLSRRNLGSVIVPQHDIWLYLDRNKRVTAGIDKISSLTGETSHRIRFVK